MVMWKVLYVWAELTKDVVHMWLHDVTLIVQSIINLESSLQSGAGLARRMTRLMKALAISFSPSF